MSELIVTPVVISEIQEHPNADALEIAKIGGWQIVIGKGSYSVGDTVVHVPPDAMVPLPLAQKWGVDKYLAWKKGAWRGRVKAARLRGQTSFGFLAPYQGAAQPGQNIAAALGIEKYEPPPPPIGMSAGQMRSEHPMFHRYTDIQNLRNYPDKLNYGVPLVVTEKIHGTNSRVGWVRTKEDEDFEFVCGTHRTQRDPYECGIYSIPHEKYGDIMRQIFEWCKDVVEEPITSVIFFGEIYGPGVQDLHYGKEKDYRVFDIAINGLYLPWSTLEYFNENYGLPLVPILFRGVTDFEHLLEIAGGGTTMQDSHIREGVVVHPWHIEESWSKGTQDPNPKRMIFKVISDEYLTRKNGTEFH